MLGTAVTRLLTTISILGLCGLLAGSSVAAPNLIVNGDFAISAKNKQGFDTQYVYSAGNLGKEGTYDIVQFGSADQG
jgi:hypothetical protein